VRIKNKLNILRERENKFCYIKSLVRIKNKLNILREREREREKWMRFVNLKFPIELERGVRGREG
jgi:hypothetical protein